MGWEIKIDGGRVVMDANVSFQIGFQKSITDLGVVEHVDYTLEVVGDIADPVAFDTPAKVADEFVLKSQEVTDRFSEVQIELVLDGVTKFNWLPSAGFNGPHITRFASIPEDGNADSHWRFALSVLFKGKGNPENEDLSNLQLSLQVITIRNRIVRKVWRAAGTGISAAAALTSLRRFRPASNELVEDETRVFTEARAITVWAWDALQDIAETIVRLPGFKDFVSEGQVGVNSPAFLHLKMATETTILINGTRRAYGPLIVAPPAHFVEGPNIFRAEKRERRHEVRIENATQGIFSLEYDEVWLITGGTIPPANHQGGKHNTEIKFVSAPPSDGRMASFTP